MDINLPEIRNRDHYKELFTEDKNWDQVVRYLIDKHRLCGEMKRGSLGSHIVYRVGDVWIKIMAPIFAQDMDYELSGLSAVEGKLSVKTPRVLFVGEMRGWPYVILSHVEGLPIRQIWSSLSLDQQVVLTGQAAGILDEINRCESDARIQSRFCWNDFILEQYLKCEEQQLKKGLPENWVSHVKKFLSTFEISEFQTKCPVFLHADLTSDHFLIEPSETPRITGLIDLADCQLGHYEYDLVAPLVFIFQSKPQLISHFLICRGLKASQLNARCSEKLLAWCLLHRYFSLISYFSEDLQSCRAGDFQSLAKKIFPLEFGSN